MEQEIDDKLRQTVGGTVSYFLADHHALDRRVQRTSTLGGTERLVYDGFDVVRELDANGATIGE